MGQNKFQVTSSIESTVVRRLGNIYNITVSCKSKSKTCERVDIYGVLSALLSTSVECVKQQ